MRSVPPQEEDSLSSVHAKLLPEQEIMYMCVILTIHVSHYDHDHHHNLLSSTHIHRVAFTSPLWSSHAFSLFHWWD